MVTVIIVISLIIIYLNFIGTIASAFTINTTIIVVIEFIIVVVLV
jgi:hypothetical protein